MKTRFLLAIMLVPTVLVAGNLKLVTTVRYEDLRNEIPSLVPGYDYGDQGVQLWAHLEEDCFESPQDVIDLFHQWLAVWYPGHGFPRVLEMRCRPAAPDTSLAVIAEVPVHGDVPEELHVFVASPTGAQVIQRLFDDVGVGGGPLLENPFLSFLIENGRATAVLYCDQSIRDEHGEGCSVYPGSTGGKMQKFYTTALYRIEKPGDQGFLAVNDVGPGEWAIQRIGAEVTQVAKLKANPEKLSKDMFGIKATRERERVQQFLSKFDVLVKEQDATKVFDFTYYLRKYTNILEGREMMDAAAPSGGTAGGP